MPTKYPTQLSIKLDGPTRTAVETKAKKENISLGEAARYFLTRGIRASKGEKHEKNAA